MLVQCPVGQVQSLLLLSRNMKRAVKSSKSPLHLASLRRVHLANSIAYMRSAGIQTGMDMELNPYQAMHLG